eukprot:jgi/Tetstr1/454190/TSEL_041109.t1
MCWSAGVSLATYLFSAGASAVSVVCHRRAPNLLYLNFIHMQLVEYFMWRDRGCTGANQAAGRVGLTLVMLQPLCSLLSSSPHLTWPAVSRLPARLLPWRRKVYSAGALQAYAAITAAMMAARHLLPPPSSIGYWCSVPGATSHLTWRWLTNLHPALDYGGGAVYYAMCFLPMVCSRQWGTASLYGGMWAYSMAHHMATGGWASVWCFLVNARAVGYLFGA